VRRLTCAILPVSDPAPQPCANPCRASLAPTTAGQLPHDRTSSCAPTS
jgi:hypothetical protein